MRILRITVGFELDLKKINSQGERTKYNKLVLSLFVEPFDRYIDMEVNDITYIDRLLLGCSDKRCAEIPKEVTEECQSRIDECKKGAYSKSLQ